MLTPDERAALEKELADQEALRAVYEVRAAAADAVFRAAGVRIAEIRALLAEAPSAVDVVQAAVADAAAVEAKTDAELLAEITAEKAPVEAPVEMAKEIAK